MEMIINLFRDSFAYTCHAFELAEPGAGNCSRRAEMVQQRLLAAGADPRDLVERRAPERLGPLGAVRADRKAMRLVAQALQEIEDGVARVERERRPARQEETLAPGVAVRSLGDPGDRDIGDAELFETPCADMS